MRRTPERARQPRLDIGRNPENGVDRLPRLPSQFNRAPSPGMAGICAERSSRIAAVEVAIGGIRAIRARVLPQDFRCNIEREMFMQRQNAMASAPYLEPFPEVSFAQESDEYRAFPRRVPVRKATFRYFVGSHSRASRCASAI